MLSFQRFNFLVNVSWVDFWFCFSFGWSWSNTSLLLHFMIIEKLVNEGGNGNRCILLRRMVSTSNGSFDAFLLNFFRRGPELKVVFLLFVSRIENFRHVYSWRIQSSFFWLFTLIGKLRFVNSNLIKIKRLISNWHSILRIGWLRPSWSSLRIKSFVSSRSLCRFGRFGSVLVLSLLLLSPIINFLMGNISFLPSWVNSSRTFSSYAVNVLDILHLSVIRWSIFRFNVLHPVFRTLDSISLSKRISNPSFLNISWEQS